MKFNESKFNKHWQDKNLSELGKFQRGKSKHRPRNDQVLFENGIYPLVQTGDIKEANLYIRQHKEAYNEIGLSQSKLWKKNTLCITIAANIAETALLAYPMCFPDSVVGFNAYPHESSELFMHYVFTYIKKSIQNSATGSIQDNINIDYLTQLKFKIPNKVYQDKIVFILSSLDDKIELNNRINSELENLAKTIYDYWFVQFDFPDENGKPYKSSGGKMVYNQDLKREIPVGWEVKLLEEVLTIVRGSSPRPIDNFLSDNGLPWIKISDATSSNNRFIFETKQFILEEGIPYTRNIPPDTLILSNSATPGLPRIVKISAGVHDGWLIIMNYKKGLTQEFMYHYFSFEQRRVVSFGSGSIFKNLKTDYIKNLKIALPPKLILEKVSPKFKAISELISIKSQENQQLTQLRDWLLPMLMNGQITIK